jgi:hypothetical protein
MTSIQIRQVYNIGSIHKIEVFTNGAFTTVWGRHIDTGANIQGAFALVGVTNTVVVPTPLVTWVSVISGGNVAPRRSISNSREVKNLCIRPLLEGLPYIRNNP